MAIGAMEHLCRADGAGGAADITNDHLCDHGFRKYRLDQAPDNVGAGTRRQGMIIGTWAEAGALPAHSAARASLARHKNFITVFPSQYGSLRALKGSLDRVAFAGQVQFAGGSRAV